MNFYDFIDRVELKSIINQAKKNSVNEAVEKLKEFDAMNETFFKACMPKNSPDILIKKRKNKLSRMKRKKEIKKYTNGI